MSERTVMIVDDDEAIAHLLSMVFRDEGYAVVAARQGAEALSLLDQHTPDAILLDLAMPVMDGATFYQRLREHGREAVRTAPVLIISAVGARRAQRELGAESAMEKPVDLEDLVAEVARLISGRADHSAAIRLPEGVATSP